MYVKDEGLNLETCVSTVNSIIFYYGLLGDV